MSLQVLVMAAGKGTRMRSARPKVLHRLAGRALLDHVLDAAATLAPRRTVVVVGHEAAQVEAHVGARGVCVRQEPQLGTGHAVREALPALAGDAAVTLILNGDVPLIAPATARALVDACGGTRLALLTVALDDPGGYGRILRRADGGIAGIVEHKDASESERAIREVYTGLMAAPTAALVRWVAALKADNAQREYYLTDIVAMAVAEGVPVVGASAASETEVLGINSPAQLAELERRLQARQAQALMEAGVRLADPARIDVRGTLACGCDVEIDVGCVFEGQVALGDGVRIGPYCVLKDVTIGAGTQVAAYTHMEGARVGADGRIGPFARLRPGADLADEVHVGNFVEVKNSTLARGAKANHLAYLGDATLGARSNFGAGSITANYDGVNKHRTEIGADVLIGSNCVLVAPLSVGDGATVGGGSTLTRAAPAGQLTLTRAPQSSYANWKRPARKGA